LFVCLEELVDDPYSWTVEVVQCERPRRKICALYVTEEEARTGGA